MRRNTIGSKTVVSVLGLLLVYALPFVTLFGATDMFLKIGSIKGEAVDENFKDWIVAHSYQHGVTIPVSSDGTIAGAASLAPVTVRKIVDSATPPVFGELARGTLNTIELEFVRDDASRQRFYRVKLHDALVTAIAFSGSGSVPQEDIRFHFKKMDVTYTEFNSKGKADQETTAWYDVIRGVGDIYVTDLSNTHPTISSIPATNTAEDTPVMVNFTVDDAQTSPGSLFVSAVSSSNPALAPVSNISFGGSAANRTATIHPVADQTGTSTITIQVSDGSLVATTSFLLTVDPVNDAPTISLISAQTTEMNTPLTVNFQIEDVDNAEDSLVLAAQSSSQALVPDGNIVFGGTGNDRSVTMTPSSGQTGETTITLTVSDGGSSSNTSFVLSVIEYTPQSPTDILLSNSSIPENSTNGTVVGTFSAVDPDSTNHVFDLLDSAGGRFRVEGNQLLVENGALLDFEAADSHSILVKATDDDDFQFSKTLTVQVANVNEAPVFIVEDSSVIETVVGYDTPVTRFQLSDPDAGENELQLTLEVVNGILNVSSNFTGTIASNGTAEVTLSGSLADLNNLLASTNGLLYRATTNANGTDLLTATITDNGHSGLGSANEAYTTLGIYFFRSLYAQWLSGKFSEAELNDDELESALWGANADPDADGLENLAEYGLGTEPREPDAALNSAFVSKSGQDYLSLQFKRRKDPALVLVVEVSGEVADGTWSSDPATLEVFESVDLNDGFEQVRFDDQVPVAETARRFMRLRWSLLPE